MKEVRIEDCKVGMALKLKEDCPFRKEWGIDPKTPVKCIVKWINVNHKDAIFVHVHFKSGQRGGSPADWYFYDDDSPIDGSDYELISLNLEYATKRKNNYY